MPKEIPLTRGFVTIVDDEDFEWVSQQSWYASGRPGGDYAVGWDGKAKRNIYLHRLIMGAADGQSVDHINGDKLDNRRCNLRFCTPSQNAANRRVKKRDSAVSPYRGIFWARERHHWRVFIMVDGKRRQAGQVFHSPEAAARAYDRMAVAAFGEFATLNFTPSRDWIFTCEVQGEWPPAALGAAA